MTGPAREWVTFPDPKNKHHKWEIDVTFLTSHWNCIYGCGCQGVLTEPAPEMHQGCCSYGAHFTDKKDRDKVVRMAKQLRDDEWQFAKAGRKKGVVAKAGKGDWRTRLVQDACIFLNRPGFPGGPGCAFHVHAMNSGVHHSELKPEVCWQLPLTVDTRDEDDDTTTSVLTEFGRTGWGEGGEEFAWWCTEDPAAFTGAEPVYRSMADELRLTLGDALYPEVVEYLDRRTKGDGVPLPHPTESPVEFSSRR